MISFPLTLCLISALIVPGVPVLGGIIMGGLWGISVYHFSEDQTKIRENEVKIIFRIKNLEICAGECLFFLRNWNALLARVFAGNAD